MTSRTVSGSSSSSSNILLVHERQRGNPILKHIKNIRWEYTKEIASDYAMTSTCVVFVSIQYHLSNANYTVRRLREMGKNYRTRILLTRVDAENTTAALLDLNKLCFSHDFTLLLAWSDFECARYLEALREYEGKPSTAIQERVETEYLPRVAKLLTTIKSVNKTDVNTLLDTFGNLSSVFTATEQQMMLCPGLGERKVKRLHQVLHEPFLKKAKVESAQPKSSATKPASGPS
jgi:DNA excision repair protein ERCC-1